MRWEDERYVRLYTRETPEDVALGWEALALWWAILRRFDRAGILELGKTGVRGLAGLTRMPFELVERSLPLLLEDGRVQLRGTTLICPNYIIANETPQSDRARQREKRDRDRARVMGEEPHVPSQNVIPASQSVTACHENAEAVTSSHAPSLRADPCRAVPSSTDPRDPPHPPLGGAPGGEGPAQVRDAAAPAEPSPAKPRGSKAPAAAPKERRRKAAPESSRRYAEAFAAGITAVTGVPFPPPVDSHDQHLFATALPAHAQSGDGPLTGEALDGWVRWAAEMYARSTMHQGSMQGGFSVRRWADWLNSGGHDKPCVRVGFFGGDALAIYAETYPKSQMRGYGPYVSAGAEDDREAVAVAELLSAKVLAHVDGKGLSSTEIRALCAANMTLWSKQYLRLDGWRGGQQYVEQGHRFRYLGKNVNLYGTTWAMKAIDPRPGARASSAQPPPGKDDFDWKTVQEPPPQEGS